MSGKNGNMVAEYWKNGTVIRLTDGSNYARANSIVVAEGNVYAAGAEFRDGNFFVAKYWLNGRAVAITDSSNYSMASGIAVWGQDVYLAGKELKGAFMQGNPVALYWKNSGEITIQDTSHAGWTNSVFLADNSSQNQKKKQIAYQGLSSGEQEEKHSFADIFLSVFHFLKSSPDPSSTSNTGSHSNSGSKATNSNANQSKQNLAESNRK